jgi:hypothetical protein
LTSLFIELIDSAALAHSTLDGIFCGLMWLGPKRRQLTDWTTHLCGESTGIFIALQVFRWLEGPIARPTIGMRFFDDFTAAPGLSVQPRTGVDQESRRVEWTCIQTRENITVP